MQGFKKAILVFLAAAMLLASSPLGVAQVENRTAESAAMELFNKGIGDPWVGGEPFSSDSGVAEDFGTESVQACPISYRFIGFLNVTSGLIIASDSGSSIHISPGVGNYPVYGYFEADRMTGIFIDFNSILSAI